jgi:hypothetical protein
MDFLHLNLETLSSMSSFVTTDYCRAVISTSCQWGAELTKLNVPADWKGTLPVSANAAWPCSAVPLYCDLVH